MRFLALGLGDVPNIINSAFRSLCANICDFVYPIIAKLYQVFMNMGMLFYSDSFSSIYKKISLIIGIFMVFRITFWLIEILVSPDKISDKEKNPTKIIVRVLVSIVMLAITPSLFKYAARIQYEIVSDNTIGKLMSVDKTVDADHAGRYMAAELFTNFYKASEYMPKEDSCRIFTDEGQPKWVYTQLYGSGDLNSGNRCIGDIQNVSGGDKEYKVKFDGLLAVGVGVFVAYMILMYCISVGTRYVQLIFLQIVAPIPIMCYVSPSKDNMFEKWVKQCTTTYLDLFIRIAIINFVMLLCNSVLSGSGMFNVPFSEDQGGFLIRIFIILGLLTFAKKAPDLIQELLPKSVTKASGDFGLSWKKRKDAMLGGKQIFGAASAVAKGVPIGLATGVVGAAGGRGWGRLSGFFGGVARGTINGGKKGNAFKNLNASIQKQNQVNKRKIDWANSGSTWSGRMAQRLDNAFGLEGTAERYETEINKNNDKIKDLKSSIAKEKRISSTLGKVSKYKSDMKAEAEDKILNDVFKEDSVAYKIQEKVFSAKSALTLVRNNPNASADEVSAAEMAYNAALKQAKKDFISGVFNGSIENAKIESWREDARTLINRDDDGAFDNMKSNGIFDDFSKFDAFEGQAKSKDNQLHRDKIDVVEHNIQEVEDRNAEIQASEEYQKAVADRNAVGGSSGKKS